MQSLPQEFLVLCRQLGEAQQRCSAALASQAADIQALQAEIVRLRGALVVRDTQLGMAHEALAQLKAVSPGVSRRRAMAGHIGALVERIATLSRECLRWRLAAEAREQASGKGQGSTVPQPCHLPGSQALASFDASLAAADLVICQTGCISHDEYWRVQDHCRRTGKPCILVDQPLVGRTSQAPVAIEPMVVLRTVSTPPSTAVIAMAIATAEPARSTESLSKNGC